MFRKSIEKVIKHTLIYDNQFIHSVPELREYCKRIPGKKDNGYMVTMANRRTEYSQSLTHTQQNRKLYSYKFLRTEPLKLKWIIRAIRPVFSVIEGPVVNSVIKNLTEWSFSVL